MLPNDSNNLVPDLNATIVAAVNARVEAEMLAALKGDDVIGSFVVAALRQVVEVPKPGSSYDKERVPYLTHVLRQTIQKAATLACEKFIEEEIDSIEEAVRKALKRDVNAIAAALVGQVKENAAKEYSGIKVDVNLVKRGW